MPIVVPTDSQFDGLFEETRKKSEETYQFIREYWQMLGSGGIPDFTVITDITYAALVALQSGNTLEPNRTYRITNFASRTTVPDTITINLGPTDPLFVKAMNTDTLYPFAFKTSNTRLLIQYDLLSTDFGANRGRITRMVDPDKMLDAPFDWNVQQWARFDDGTGNFRVPFNTGLGSQLFFTFSDTQDGGLCRNCYINSGFDAIGNEIQTNITVGANTLNVAVNQSTNRIFIGSDCFDVYFESGSVECIVSNDCSNVWIGQTNFRVALDVFCFNIKTGSACSFITIEDNCTDISLGSNNGTVTIENSATDVVMSSGNTQVTIGINAQNIKMGSANSIIDIARDCTAIHLRDRNRIIDIETLCGRCSLRDENNTITISQNSSDCHIGDICQLVVIGQSNVNVAIGNRSASIATGISCQLNRIGNGSTNVIIGDDVINCVVWDGCDTLTIDNDSQNITIYDQVTNRNTLPGERNTTHRLDSIQYSTEWDFSVQGGAIGDIPLALMPPDVFIYAGWCRVETPLAGGIGATVAFGITVDDPVGIKTPTLITDAYWNGARRLTDCNYTEAGASVVTTAEQSVIITIGTAALTAGRIVLFLDCKIPV